MVPYLIEALKDKGVCDSAATALGKIGPDAKAAIPALIEMTAAIPFVQNAAGFYKRKDTTAIPDLEMAVTAQWAEHFRHTSSLQNIVEALKAIERAPHSLTCD